ncbi:hypothetical protein [Gordonia sp. DT101]
MRVALSVLGFEVLAIAVGDEEGDGDQSGDYDLASDTERADVGACRDA